MAGNRFLSAAATFACLLVWAGSTPVFAEVVLPGSDNISDRRLDLKPFSGVKACEDFKSYLAESFAEQFLTRFRCLAFAPCPLFLGAPVADSPAGGIAAPPTPDRTSGTNTQETGVDEADVIKTDGAGNLYILTGRKLVVMDAFPPAHLDQRAQAVLDLSPGDTNFSADGIFLDESQHRLVATGSTYDGTLNHSVSVIVDVSTPSAPVIVETLSVDGYPLEARRIASRIHRVSRFDIPLPESINSNAILQRERDDYFRAQDQGRDLLASRIRKDIETRISDITNTSDTAALLPNIRTGQNRQQLACTDIARSDVRTGTGLAILESFNTDGTSHTANAVVNDAGLIYASADNLYLTQNSSGWLDVLRQPRDETVIYRFALSEHSAPSYEGLGRIPGSLIGSYALGEHDGHLRVASTENVFSEAGSSLSINRLTILDATGKNLPQTGSVEGFAPGEFIRGVRFLGDRGFVVTFKQVDPLFTFDLSKPEEPRILSELTVPGFSSYLSPIGNDYLLTVGRGGDEKQLNGAVAVQLFDVRNLADIHQIAEIEPSAGMNDYSYSSSEYDPHAFSYFSDSNNTTGPGTLSIPLHVSDQSGEVFSGFLIVRVDPTSNKPLREIGRVDHRNLVQSGNCAGVRETNGSDAITPCPEIGFASEPRRSVFQQDGQGTYLYTLSNAGLLASDATNPSKELGRARLPLDPPNCCYALSESPKLVSGHANK